MTVQDPNGQTWRVSRRWVPWRRRLAGALDAVPPTPGSLGDDPVGLVLGAIFLVLLIPAAVLLLLAGLELLVLALAMPLALAGRVLLGRHWVVEVRRGWQPWWEAETGDWRACELRIYEIADEIRRGELPPRTIPG